jgi:hypothetical protein
MIEEDQERSKYTNQIFISMWKQWANAILAILVVAMAYAGTAAGWIMSAAALMLILALWAALEEVPESMQHTALGRHVH